MRAKPSTGQQLDLLSEALDAVAPARGGCCWRDGHLWTWGDGALFSDDRKHRLRLWRVWDQEKLPTVFLMFNPSRADEKDPDLTVTKCCGFARRWGAGGIVVVNVFTFVSTDPEGLSVELAAGRSITHPENDLHLTDAFRSTDLVIVACGGHELLHRPDATPSPASPLSRALALIPTGVEVQCFGRTREGHPRHPSRLAYSTEREPYQQPVPERSAS